MVQSCQDSDPDTGPVSGCDVSSRPSHGVPRRMGNHATADSRAAVAACLLRACCVSVMPCGLVDAQIDNGRDGCYTCVVVWTVVQPGSVYVRYCGRLKNP